MMGFASELCCVWSKPANVNGNPLLVTIFVEWINCITESDNCDKLSCCLMHIFCLLVIANFFVCSKKQQILLTKHDCCLLLHSRNAGKKRNWSVKPAHSMQPVGQSCLLSKIYKQQFESSLTFSFCLIFKFNRCISLLWKLPEDKIQIKLWADNFLYLVYNYSRSVKITAQVSDVYRHPMCSSALFLSGSCFLSFSSEADITTSHSIHFE